MGIGISVLLLIVGLVLLTHAVDLPASVTDHVAADTVGWICVTSSDGAGWTAAASL